MKMENAEIEKDKDAKCGESETIEANTVEADAIDAKKGESETKEGEEGESDKIEAKRGDSETKEK